MSFTLLSKEKGKVIFEKDEDGFFHKKLLVNGFKDANFFVKHYQEVTGVKKQLCRFLHSTSFKNFVRVTKSKYYIVPASKHLLEGEKLPANNKSDRVWLSDKLYEHFLLWLQKATFSGFREEMKFVDLFRKTILADVSEEKFNYEIKPQFSIHGIYSIDLLITHKKSNEVIVMEYDEKYHNREIQTLFDEQRDLNIINYFNSINKSVTIFRVPQSKDYLFLKYCVTYLTTGDIKYKNELRLHFCNENIVKKDKL